MGYQVASVKKPALVLEPGDVQDVLLRSSRITYIMDRREADFKT